ncbi:TatD family hydrolase [Candidatus Saganbacteria bacterium]|nr:TatD family hydrolase [Candidatus Saganbacteria bacterium]
MFIDTHAHLTMPEYSDLSEVIDRAKAAKVEAIINASFDIDSSNASMTLANNYDLIYAAVGIHPNDAQLVNDEAIKHISSLASNKKVVAIGETGLDYYHTIVEKEVQQKAFRIFLNLAQKLDLPVIVHCRQADNDVIRIMREENKGKLQAVFHCFAGDPNLRVFAEEMGFMVSFTGNITFKKAGLLREQAKIVPMNKLMIETDSPYLAPDPLRGSRNEPANVAIIAKKIAAIKGLSVEDVAIETTKNAREFFRI